MILNKNYSTSFRNKRYSFILLLLLFIISSCSNTDDNEQFEKNVNIKLNISTFSGVTDETDIYNVRLVAFQLDETTGLVKGMFNWLIYDNPTEDASITGKPINIVIPKGKYKMYYFANAERRLVRPTLSKQVKEASSENVLKSIYLNYGIVGNGLMPKPDLIMTGYEEVTLIEGDIRTIELNQTCVKVSYTLTFDNTDLSIDAALQNKKFEIRSIQFKNLAIKSNLLESINYSDQGFFDGTLESIGVAKNSDFNNNSWTYQGTAYIPECIYPATPGVTSYMEIIGGIIGNPTNYKYQVQLVGLSTDKNKIVTPRGNEYIIDGKIKSLGVTLFTNMNIVENH